MWDGGDQFFKPLGHYGHSEAAMRGDYATMGCIFVECR